MLAAAVVFGGSYLLAKMMTDRTNATVVVAQLSFWVTLGLIRASFWDPVAPFGVSCWSFLSAA